MRRIAQGMDALNRQATREAAGRPPGENIEIGLRLGDAALAFIRDGRERPAETPPLYRWRALQAERNR
jgi:hypothetical protein